MSADGLTIVGPTNGKINTGSIPAAVVTPKFEIHAGLRAAIDRAIEDQTAVRFGVFPVRYMAGIDLRIVDCKDPLPMTSANRAEALTKLVEAGMIPSTTEKKETRMPINPKDFYPYKDRITAADLSHTHIGALVEVTTTDGVKVTDVLEGLALGSIRVYHGARPSPIYATLRHIGVQDEHSGQRLGVFLEPTSKVVVRYPAEA